MMDTTSRTFVSLWLVFVKNLCFISQIFYQFLKTTKFQFSNIIQKALSKIEIVPANAINYKSNVE